MVWVRLSDLLRRSPLSVLEGAAALLLSRVYRRRASASLTAPYLEYARSDRTRERINQMRRQRVRPGAAGAPGGPVRPARTVAGIHPRKFCCKVAAAALWSE